MSLQTENARLLSDLLDNAEHRRKPKGRTGRLDPATGTLLADPTIGLPANRIWVRIGALSRTDPGREQVAVWNVGAVTTLRPDVPVKLGWNENGEREIIGLDTTIANREFGAGAAALTSDPIPEELNQTLISRRNITDFRPRVADSGGLNLYVAPGWYRGNEWVGGTLDLTSYVTATAGQYAYIVVGFDDDTGALVADTGPDYATAAAAVTADIATVFAGATFATARPIAAVLLQEGATTFLNADITDIRDVMTSRNVIHLDMLSAIAPTANDDSDDGYSIGSRWLDTTNEKEYVCLDATVSAAVWKETTVSATAGSIDVTDGSTTVSGATAIDFTSGATVTASGTTAEVAITASGGVTATFAMRTGGNLSITSATFADVDTTLDLTIPASVGDILSVSVSCLWSASGVNWSAMDAVTRVSGADVNYIGARSTTPQLGVMSWFAQAGDLVAVGGPYLYTVTSGDIDGGNVTLRLKARSTGARTLRAATGDPLQFAVVNLG